VISVLPDFVVTNAATPVTINVLANDVGSGLTITSFSNPANGSLVFNGDKTFTYTPASGFIGDDGFAYTVRDAQGTPANGEVTISVVANTGATVAADDLVEVIAGNEVVIPVRANDMAAGGGVLQIIAVSMPGHGAVNVLPDQTIRYLPQSGFTGIDSFNYTVVDGLGNSASATVTVKVLAKSHPPLAIDDTFTIEAGAPTMLAVLANDSDPDGGPLQVVGYTMPAHGQLVFNADKTFVYTPAAGYLGTDQFTYTIRNNRGASAVATVTLAVAEILEIPVAFDDQVTTEAGLPVTIDVLANDALPAGQQISIVAVTLPFKGKLAFNPDKTITYTPNPGFVGTDDFTYTIGNGQGGTAKARVTIDVTPASIAAVYANGYACRRRLAIPAGSAKGTSHQNFPLWVELAGSWLKSTANGGKVASADGHDLRFELEGGTRLAHELEHYDAVAGKLGAWVRLPELGAEQPTVLLLYYGKPGLAASEAEPETVWQDYLAVWHLPEASDSSGQGRGLVAQGSVQSTTLGLGAGSLSLNGDGVLKIDDASWLDGLDALTVQLRGKAASIGHDRGLLGAGVALFTGDSDVFIQYQAAGLGEGAPTNVVHSKIRTTAGDLLTSSAANVQKTDWQNVALTWQSGEPQSQLYLDGTQVQPSYRSQIGAPGTTRINGPLYAGSGPQDGESGGWAGLLDEVRLRPSQLSSSWIAAEHANHNDPSAFYGIGAEDSLGDSSESLVAVPLVLSTPAGTRIDIDVLGAAVLPSGATGPVIKSMSQPTHGTVSTIDDKIRYTPAAGFSGEDSFTYTLSLAGKTSTAKINIALLAIPSDYVAQVDALAPAAHYRMAETSGAVMVDRIAGKNGSWHNAPRLGIDPLVQDSAGGKSVGFKPGAASVHGRINDLVRTASFTVDLALQLDRAPAPKVIVLTTGGGSTPGEVSLEIEADGQGGARARFWSVNAAGVPVIWRTGPGTIPVASAFKLSFRRDGNLGTVDLFVDGIILPKTLVHGNPPSSWSAVPARTWHLGEWPGSASAPYEGLMAELVVWTRAVAAAELQILARAQNVVWLADFEAGETAADSSMLIDLAPYAHPATGFTPKIEKQGSFGASSLEGEKIAYAAGSSGGYVDSIEASISVNGGASRTAAIAIAIHSAGGKENVRLLGTWFGSMGWGSTGGNGGGVGRVHPYWSYRFGAERSGTVDTFRFNLPHRTNYYGGTGGVMRLTIRKNAANDWPDLTSSGILWQSPAWTLSNGQLPGSVATKISGEVFEVAIGPLALTAGQVYHIVWTNEHQDVVNNWFSINNMFNRSLPHQPYHPYGPWAKFNTLASGTSNPTSFSVRSTWIPYFLIKYTDGIWTGQPYYDGGTTNNIMALDGTGTKNGNSREIGGAWQLRQRWTHDSDTIAVTRWRGRVWRRNSSTTDPLRVRLEREETGGGVTTLADINIPASGIFQTAYDNQEGQVFSPIDVSLGGSVTLQQGRTYRLRLSSGSSTRYAMRAPNGYEKWRDNLGWGAWLGRGEYSIDGGATWTGMHMYSTDNRNGCDWNMALHNIDG
jgi:hypothetical protein